MAHIKKFGGKFILQFESLEEKQEFNRLHRDGLNVTVSQSDNQERSRARRRAAASTPGQRNRLPEEAPAPKKRKQKAPKKAETPAPAPAKIVDEAAARELEQKAKDGQHARNEASRLAAEAEHAENERKAQEAAATAAKTAAGVHEGQKPAGDSASTSQPDREATEAERHKGSPPETQPQDGLTAADPNVNPAPISMPADEQNSQPTAAPPPHPLDHDGDGKPGGSTTRQESPKHWKAGDAPKTGVTASLNEEPGTPKKAAEPKAKNK